jgi:hypothetical protein
MPQPMQSYNLWCPCPATNTIIRNKISITAIATTTTSNRFGFRAIDFGRFNLRVIQKSDGKAKSMLRRMP